MRIGASEENGNEAKAEPTLVVQKVKVGGKKGSCCHTSAILSKVRIVGFETASGL